MRTPPRKITVEIITADPTNTEAIKALLEICRQLSCNYGGVNWYLEQSAVQFSAPSLQWQQLANCPVCNALLDPKSIICFTCIANNYGLTTSLEDTTGA